jgi:hypothetical protein
MAEVTITVAEPDLAAAVCLFGAVVAIDLWAIRSRRSTISRWYSHHLQHRPAVTLTATGLLLAHLCGRVPFDPFRLVARWIDRGDT